MLLKVIIVLSVASGGISISSFVSVIGDAAGIASANFTLGFPSATGIIKKLIQVI